MKGEHVDPGGSHGPCFCTPQVKKKTRHLILGYGHGLPSPWLLVTHLNTWRTNSERPMLSNHCHSIPHNNHSDMLVEGSSGFEKGSQLWVLQTALCRAPHNFFNFIKAIFHQQIQGRKLQLISTEMSQDFRILLEMVPPPPPTEWFKQGHRWTFGGLLLQFPNIFCVTHNV